MTSCYAFDSCRAFSLPALRGDPRATARGTVGECILESEHRFSTLFYAQIHRMQSNFGSGSTASSDSGTTTTHQRSMSAVCAEPKSFLVPHLDAANSRVNYSELQLYAHTEIGSGGHGTVYKYVCLRDTTVASDPWWDRPSAQYFYLVPRSNFLTGTHI